MIEIKNLSFRYPGQDVLKSISITLEKGGLTALIGLNGAGKSTLFRCLMKLEHVERGMIFIDGQDINDITTKELAKRIAFVSQINTILRSDTLVKDFIVEGRTPYIRLFSLPSMSDYEKVEKWANTLGIESLLYRALNTLSGGEAQLVSIARALIQETPLIVLDEPTSALDIINQYKILLLIKKINKEGKSILFSTHDPNQAILLDANVCFLNNGGIVASGLAKEVINEANLRDVYGEAIQLVEKDNMKFCFLNRIDI